MPDEPKVKALSETCWLIVFEDGELNPEVFTDEQSARARYSALDDNWNVHLFCHEQQLAAEREPVHNEKIQSALQMVYDLCHQKRRWIMSIPARPDYDPDIVIADGLQEGLKAIKQADQLRREIADLSSISRTEIDRLNAEIASLKDQIEAMGSDMAKMSVRHGKELESARVCDCCGGTKRILAGLSVGDGPGATVPCPHCINGVRFDAKESNVGLAHNS